MTLRVHIAPTLAQVSADNGVGQVIHAQYRYLPDCGIELVEDPHSADVVAAHIQQGDLPRVDVLHSHGLYFADVPHFPYAEWHHDANRRILAAARQALAITVPSAWVAEPFKRDMRLAPDVIGHGVDIEEWEPQQPLGYALWNKNRAGDVCLPDAAMWLARQGVPVVSTFGMPGEAVPDKARIIGAQPHAEMRNFIQHASVYLATTRETFGIGTLEALASGVPVLGFAVGATPELVQHRVTGYLVQPGDHEALYDGWRWLLRNREVVSAACRAAARAYDWRRVMERYAAVYVRAAERRRVETGRVSVVITNYNYAAYIEQAIVSVVGQSSPVDELIVVDDGSTDDTIARCHRMLDTYPGPTCIHIMTQDNQGVAAARNHGVAAATGDYIICLDADDRLHERYVEVCKAALDRDRGLGIAYAGIGIIRDGGLVEPTGWPPAFNWAVQAQPTNPPSTCVPTAAMFRKALWERAGGYLQVHAPGEDAEFYTRGLSVGFGAQKVADEPLIEYRLHEGSASRTKAYKPIDLWHPWMRDKQYPMAAPSQDRPLVRSYAEPLISVIVPVGPGHAPYLRAALDSLLGQTFRAWEVIVVNDTGLGLRLESYPFARIVDAPDAGIGVGIGPGGARNVGLALARAPLCVFLDADDWLAPTALERMLAAYQLHGASKYIYTKWIAVNGERVTEDPAPDYDQRAWLNQGQHAITVLMETAWARAVGFDEKLTGWEDWVFFIEQAIRGRCGALLAEPLLYYRQHSGQRRESSLAQKDALLPLIKDRYARYIAGEEPLMSCCGGNAEVLLEIRRRVLGEESLAQVAPPPGPSGKTMLEFIGRQEAPVTIYSQDRKRAYRAGRSPLHRMHEVTNEDVDFLLNSGEFRRA